MRKLNLIVLLLSTIALSACAPKAAYTGGTGSLQELKALKGQPIDEKTETRTSGIRYAGLKEMAMSTGAQSALSSRGTYINEVLTHHKRHLDDVYNFNALLLNHSVMPPILVEGRNTLNLADGSAIRISDRTYKILKQARFVTTPLNWRQYLWMNYKPPETPPNGFLPKTDYEKQVWRFYVTKGWNQGIRQANTIFNDNLARLTEDFNGMILYRKLLAQHMVTPPYVATTNLGVTGGGNDLHINDQVLRITALPTLDANSKNWRSLVSTDKHYHEGGYHKTYPGKAYPRPRS